MSQNLIIYIYGLGCFQSVSTRCGRSRSDSHGTRCWTFHGWRLCSRRSLGTACTWVFQDQVWRFHQRFRCSVPQLLMSCLRKTRHVRAGFLSTWSKSQRTNRSDTRRMAHRSNSWPRQSNRWNGTLALLTYQWFHQAWLWNLVAPIAFRWLGRFPNQAL